MIIHLTYSFNLFNNHYEAINADIGETIDIKREARDLYGLKTSAIYHAIDIEPDKIPHILPLAKFEYCELATDTI